VLCCLLLLPEEREEEEEARKEKKERLTRGPCRKGKRKKQRQWTEWFTGKEIFSRWFSRTLAGCNGSQGK
jgi:hypothetical protein